MTELMEQLRIDAAQRPVSGEEESDDNLVRLWQDELREAREKLEVYRSDASASRAFGADVRHTQAMLESLPARIATRRAEIAYEQWAQEALAGLEEIPVSSMDRSFAAIPKKSHLWADWSVWNFKRHRLDRAKALPAEAVQRARGSLTHFDRLEVWQAVGTADPWLVGVVRTPNDRERFYLVYDWGVETSAGRDALR